jgi:diguanylate cyclase (GGDEF)-like protein
VLRGQFSNQVEAAQIFADALAPEPPKSIRQSDFAGIILPEAVGEGRELSKILVIDDDRFAASLIDNTLRSAGFMSSYCCDPREAVAKVTEELPDLIIMDVVMPELDGFELCRRVRAHPALQFTPIIFVTRKGDLEQRIRGLELGGNDYISKPFEPQELIARVRSHLMRLASLRQMAISDGLTRCFNHKFFRMRLEQEATRARRYEHGLAVAMLDLDRFKRINDEHGHAAGDFVLANVATLVLASLRSTDIVARYGGEEFAIIMVHAGAHEAEVICERVRDRIAKHEFVFTPEREGATERKIAVTVSVGIAEFKHKTDNWRSLLQRADSALFEAKGAGRNRVALRP